MVHEPVRGGFPDPAFYGLPGIEQLRAYLTGLAPHPPLTRLTGAKITQVGSGTASGSLPASPWLMQLDSLEVTMLAARTLQVAVQTGVPPATRLDLLAFSVHHLRPANPESGAVITRARVVHSGRTVTVAEVLVEDGSGRGVAHGTGSVATVPMQDDPPQRPLRPVEEPRYGTPDPYLRPDPHPVRAELGDGITGLELVTSVVARDVILPFAELLDWSPRDVGEGSFSCSVPVTEWLCVEPDRVDPAVLTALVSVSVHLASLTVQGVGPSLRPVHQAVQFLRSLRPDGRDIVVRARLMDWDGGRAIATTELIDADGNVVARGEQLAVPGRGRRGQAARRAERVVATVLFTDLVGSTGKAERLGDARWRDVLEEHDALVRRQLDMFKGREVKTTGDGFLATFDSPGRAVQGARAIRDALRRLGLEVRVGLHTGECEFVGADVAGIAVHIAARIQTLAGPGEVLVSGTVRDLVTGSGLRFADRGRHRLKGIEGDWPVYAVED